MAACAEDGLLGMIRRSVAEAVPAGRIGIAFSGGVDSSLMARVCSGMGYDVTLLTVGFRESHDIAFARKVNESLLLPHGIHEIDPAAFTGVSGKISRAVGSRGISWIENCIAFYYVSRLARDMGLGTVVTGNGIDELFCGYDAYRRAIPGGDSRVMEVMDEKLENELGMMGAVGAVASEFGVGVIQPLLSAGFVRYAREVPVSEKIHGPGDLLRKHVVRRLAARVGVPALSCMKRKKALQYGSKIHKNLMKSRRGAPPAA